MSDESIKINREMFREAWDRCDPRKMNDIDLTALERELFGPRKPREWWVGIDSNGHVDRWKIYQNVAPDERDLQSGRIKWVRVREVIDDK